jgi:hypothetical protein
MSKDLVTVSLNQVPAVGVSVASELVTELTKSGEFLDRIQLYTKGRAIDQGLISPGHYGVPTGDDNILDLGTEIDILPLCCRPKALDLRDRDAIVTNYDPTSEAFKSIEEMAKTQDSGCMYGLSFLIFERGSAKFYELFCGTKSMRTESRKILAFAPLPEEGAAQIEKNSGVHVDPHGPIPCTLKAKYVTKRNWGWHVPVCVQCSTPFTNLPTIERINSEVEKFMNLANTEIEKAEATPASKRPR